MALGKQAGAFDAAAMKCSDRTEQLPHRTEKLSNGASGFGNGPMLRRAQPGKASKKKVRLRAKLTTFGNGVMAMLPQSTKGARGCAITYRAFLL